MKKILSILLVLMLLLSITACAAPKTEEPKTEEPSKQQPETKEPEGEEEPSGETFRISTYLQLSGSNAEAGNNAKNGIDLAVKYINENGGFNGAQVVVDHYDTTGSTEEAVKIVQKVLENKSADAIIGSVNSNEVSACISYINEAELYNFGLGTSATWMEDQSMIWTFRASANNNRIAPLDVDMILELGYDTVAIISGTDDTGSSTATAFEKACAEKGLTVTTRQECDTADTDFSGQITQILATDPDTIFMSLIGDTFGPFVKQLRNMGYNGMLACKECFSTAYQEVAGYENSNYIAFVYPYVPYNSVEECTIPYMRSMLEKYYAEYGKCPTHESAYRGWDTMMAMWEASKIAGSNESDALREATHKVKIDGLGGTLDYTKGDREGYSAFNSFVLVDGQNILLDEWLSSGGYEAYKTATGRDR
ncbi:MAG: Leucine-, isoleucine-, valine-, threonine-, and alanine-binding protein precursor [Firmicutes bacterium ADurb.Bin182]|nr:MAG: Leucine-, isoleucine-, valine-, threonine-, and alanine-binding protein precursor [Firmicutes bacterium ADurb.Bin182]